VRCRPCVPSPWIVQARIFATMAFLVRVARNVPDVGRLEQGLGGNAPYQEASAAEPGLLSTSAVFNPYLAGADAASSRRTTSMTIRS